MSLYLLNTNLLTNDNQVLRNVPDAKIIEVGECDYFVPVTWLACFRQTDLHPCTVIMHNSAGEEILMSILVPCTDVQTAIENVRVSLPLIEKLTGEKHYSREYWQQTIDDLANLTLPYLTMDLSEMLMNYEPQEFNESITCALGRTADSLDVMKKIFIAYDDSHLPYSRDHFYANTDITDEKRIDNTIAIDSAIQDDGFVRHQPRSA